MFHFLSRKQFWFIVFLILVYISLASNFIFKKYSKPDLSLVSQEYNFISNPIKLTLPIPFPFQEMTIPYLRARDYKSSLGDLEKFADNGSYTSYLTSYDSDGLKINGLLTQPKGEKPSGGWPAIIFIHGYIPPTQYQTTVNYSSYADYLARNGFVVFKIDLRGHNESEGEASGAYYSGDYIIDTLNAYTALQTSDLVNPKKIGLWGHSMAGNVVLRSLAAKPQIPAVVIWSGAVYTYSDMQEFGINDGSYRPPQNATERQRKRQELREQYGDFSPDSEFWKQVAATNYLNDIKGKIQINHTINDDVVPIGYSRNLNKLLDETKVIHELNEYSFGGHNFTGAVFTQAMEKTIEFFRKNLE